MNTIRSTWIGWGTLCVAAGGAYYFAKQSIKTERAVRYEAEVKPKAWLKAMEAEHRQQAEMNATTPNSRDGTKLKRERDTIPERGYGGYAASPINEAPLRSQPGPT